MYTHALYYLATYPEYAQPLRVEVEGAINDNGWTKHALMKMRKLDSFIKESLRLNPLAYSTFPVFGLILELASPAWSWERELDSAMAYL
jgi:cytochrome P450